MYEFNYQKAASIDEAKSFHGAAEEPKYVRWHDPSADIKTEACEAL